MIGAMADKALRAVLSQALRHAIADQIGAADGNASLEEHPGDAAHARPADGDEMRALDVTKEHSVRALLNAS
jgi:hypothetical protein